MFFWVLNYALYIQCKQIDRFMFDTNFYRKVFSKQAFDIWILIPIIPQYIVKLRAKKVTLNMTKFSFKLKFRMIRNFSVIQQKHALTCPGLYSLIFQSLYHTSLISSKREINETENFRNFHKLFTNKFAAFL